MGALPKRKVSRHRRGNRRRHDEDAYGKHHGNEVQRRDPPAARPAGRAHAEPLHDHQRRREYKRDRNEQDHGKRDQRHVVTLRRAASRTSGERATALPRRAREIAALGCEI